METIQPFIRAALALVALAQALAAPRKDVPVNTPGLSSPAAATNPTSSPCLS